MLWDDKKNKKKMKTKPISIWMLDIINACCIIILYTTTLPHKALRLVRYIVNCLGKD